VVNVLYTPAETEVKTLWEYTTQFGYIIIWFGITTMFIAAFIALFQTNAKRILAYSSVSQMGYILMGIGACAYLGLEGPMAMGGFTLHVVNHAFFKAGMFMMVGAVYFRTGEIDIKKLGGLWREFPVTAAVFLLAAMGIAGIPGLNGYTSKVLLHHAIVEAFEHHHLYSLYLAERIFMLTGVLTTCYIARLFSSIFLGQKPDNLQVKGKEPWNEQIVFIAIGLVILFIGTNPFLVLKKMVAPVVQVFNFEEYYYNYLLKVNFWDSHDLLGMVGVVAVAALLFYFAARYKLFEIKLPAWLNIEMLIYRPAVNFFNTIFTSSGRALETTVDGGFIKSIYLLKYFCASGKILDYSADYLIVETLGPLKSISYRISELENGSVYFGNIAGGLSLLFNNIYQFWLYTMRSLFHFLKRFFMNIFNFLFQLDYKHEGRFYLLVNTANFEYYLLVFFMMLIIIMSLHLFR